MMPLNNNKRKGRISNVNKPGRPKVLQEKNSSLEGIYGNARFMHTAASLVGSIVNVRVKNGNIYEGVFRTFSQEMDVVLEMARLIDNNQAASCLFNGTILPLMTEDLITEKLIFKLHDIVMLSAINIDLDYATKDNFTDVAISKFNGQITEKELEPWHGANNNVDKLSSLEGENEDNNGWDVNDMFKTNAEKYGVVSSYDNSLQGYTVKLEHKNTDEYKQKEAEALRIAQEIQSSPLYQARLSAENGDEEDQFSAVVRPDKRNSNVHPLPQRKKNPYVVKGTRNNNNNNNNNNSSHNVQNSSKHSQVSSSSSQYVSCPAIASHNHVKTSNTALTNSVSTSSIPQSVSTTFVSKSSSHVSVPRKNHQVKVDSTAKNNEGSGKKEQKPTVSNSQASVNVNKERTTVDTPVISEASTVSENRISEKQEETEKKVTNQKARNEKKTEELKKFHATFKLSEENKDERKEKPEVAKENTNKVPASNVKEDKEKSETEVEKRSSPHTESIPTLLRSSTLNPHAEAFMPRAVQVQSPLTSVPSSTPPLPTNRIQNPIVPLHPQLMAAMAPPFYTAMAPQFVMAATPVNISLAPPFHPVSLDKGLSSRKAAATGTPILETAQGQLALQYPHSPGIMPFAGHQPLAYPQMYPMIGPRVLSPQPVGMMTSANPSQGETPQFSTNLYMPPHLGTSTAVPTHTIPVNSVPQGSVGSHSNASTPHSHASSPVNQPPSNGTHITPAHTPTPTGHPGPALTPQPIVYHGLIQHSLQSGTNVLNSTTSLNNHIAHFNQHSHNNHPNYEAPSHPLVFVPNNFIRYFRVILSTARIPATIQLHPPR
ncbi:ataxin-2-like protein isoform X3 [Centruroides vittatus]|uniref:ataxin-2-like protein isoform X3 n=1 Tax=Centruroides vittatus TaxID=120091 RepID=UPI0035101A60